MLSLYDLVEKVSVRGPRIVLSAPNASRMPSAPRLRLYLCRKS
jgi:hypothetical protein